MQKILISLVAALVLLNPLAAQALDSGSEAEYLTAKNAALQSKTAHNQAQENYLSDRTPENATKVVDTGKDYLQKALTEAEEWLLWKNTAAQSNIYASATTKSQISGEVSGKIANINNYRNDVSNVTNQVELAAMKLKLTGAYIEFIVDVGRYSGQVWVDTGYAIVDKVADYENRLRTTAVGLTDNADILSELDKAMVEIDNCRANIAAAEKSYQAVTMNNKPYVNFSEGNQSLYNAKTNLNNARVHLSQALVLINS